MSELVTWLGEHVAVPRWMLLFNGAVMAWAGIVTAVGIAWALGRLFGLVKR